MAPKLFAIIAGAGTGTGRACALRFAKAYTVVLMARTPNSYQDTVNEINESGGQAVGISADAADAKSMKSAFEAISDEMAGLKLTAAVYNVSSGTAIKPFLETKVGTSMLVLRGMHAIYETWDHKIKLTETSRGLFIFAQQIMPLLLDTVGAGDHPPTMLITGATASVRGGAKFSALASGMFASCAIGQSLAREFGPQGVHVAHAIIDGVIDIPRTNGYTVNGGVEDGKLSPDAIAESYWHLHTQHPSAFTQELDMRPFVEKF